MNDTLKIFSLNARGLGDKKKLCTILLWLKAKGSGIFLLQECHSTIALELNWNQYWEGDIFSYGESNARGVAILVSKQLPVAMSDIARDDTGRFLLLDCKIYDIRYIIVNIYASTIDKASEEKQFGEFLLSALEQYVGLNMIIGGDFNMLPCSSHTVSFSDCLIQLFYKLDLIDIWRLRHPSTNYYTR